jgi:hypothetical protein
MDQIKRSPRLFRTAQIELEYLRALHYADVLAVELFNNPPALALAKSIYRLKRFKRLQKSLSKNAVS